MKGPLRDLAGRAPGAGHLDRARTGRAEHPVCGDELELDLRIADGRVEALAWRARGCPATLAVAAALEGAWVGAAVTDAPERLRARLAALGGLAAHEGHAERLALRALAEALAQGPSP